MNGGDARARSRLAIPCLAGLAIAVGLLGAWGVGVGETAQLGIATVLLVGLPGWVLTQPLAAALDRDERCVVAGNLGLATTALVHLLWNSHLAPIAWLPDTTTALRAGCAGATLVAAIRWLRARRAPAPRASEARRGAGWLTLAMALAPIPALLPFATPNGQLDATGIRFDMDELTHFYLVGSLLREGPPSVSTLAGFPMPPYQFLVPSLTAAYLRIVDVDPIVLQCRWLPLVTIALASASFWILARRWLTSAHAAVLATLALAYAGDPVTTWGLTSQTHSAVAYASFACATFLLGAGSEPSPPRVGAAAGGGRAAALVAAGVLVATLFQSKAPLFFTAAGALGTFALDGLWRRRDPRGVAALAAMIASVAVIGIDHWGSVRGSPLGLAPGANVAAALASLPAPWNVLGGSRAIGFVLGLVLIVALVGNLRWLALPWWLRRARRSRSISPATGFLLAAIAGGLVAADVVHEPDHPASLAPLWFVQHPLLIASQLAAGAAASAWLLAAPRAAYRRRCAALAALALGSTALFTIALGVGDDPLRFERAERDCGAWLREHSALDARVLHAPARTGLPIFSLRASVLALEPILKGEKPNAIAPTEYLDRLHATVAARRAEVERFFATPDAEEARAIARRLDASFLFLGEHDPIAVDPTTTFGAPLTSCGEGGRVFPLARATSPGDAPLAR
ncbi:MAG: hypothetical protein U0610_04655 [bacterium]